MITKFKLYLAAAGLIALIFLSVAAVSSTQVLDFFSESPSIATEIAGNPWEEYHCHDDGTCHN